MGDGGDARERAQQDGTPLERTTGEPDVHPEEEAGTSGDQERIAPPDQERTEPPEEAREPGTGEGGGV